MSVQSEGEETIVHYQKLLRTLQQRFQQRELQEAQQGINTPPEVLTEIQELQTRIRAVQAELGRLQASRYPSGNTVLGPVLSQEYVRLLPTNDLGKNLQIGGIYEGIFLNVVASTWAAYSDVGWVISGWLYIPPKSGPSHALTFFKVHIFDDGRGYVQILDAGNPSHTIWFIAGSHFKQEQQFCWDSTSGIDRCAVWHFTWK